GRLGCVVGVQYAAAGSGGVLSNVLQVADGRLEAVLHRTQLGTFAVDLLHGTVQNLNGLLRAVSGGDIQVGDAHLLNHCCVAAGHVSQTQRCQTSTRRSICNSEVTLREQSQLTTVVGRGHASTGGVDRGHDGFHITALGQLDFGTVQGDGGILKQLGLGSACIQTQRLQSARRVCTICQLNRFTIGRSQDQSTVLDISFDISVICLVVDFIDHISKLVTCINLNFFAVDSESSGLKKALCRSGKASNQANTVASPRRGGNLKLF